RDFADRQGGATARVAIELRQNDTRDVERLVESSGDTHRLLARRRVNHQKGFLWLQKLLQFFQFLDQRFIDLLPASSVENGNIVIILTLDRGCRSALLIFLIRI